MHSNGHTSGGSSSYSARPAYPSQHQQPPAHYQPPQSSQFRPPPTTHQPYAGGGYNRGPSLPPAAAPSSANSYSLSSRSHPGGPKPNAFAVAAQAAAAAASSRVTPAARPNASGARPSGSSAHPHSSPAKPAPSSASVTAALLEAERVAEESYQKRMAEKLAEMEANEEKTEEELAAERKKKREAILAKYQVKEEAPLASVLTEAEKEKMLDDAGAIPAKGDETVEMKDAEPAPPMPTLEAAAVAAPAPVAAAPVATPAEIPTVDPAKSLSAAVDSYDMFSDDALAPEVEAGMDGMRDLTAGGGDHDAYDDHEGYYRYRLGDLLEGGRYRVTGLQGSGVFSTVLRVRELVPGQAGAPSTEGRELVVKLIRANETMYAAGQKELEYLKILAQNDPENRKHCIRLLAHFMHRGHLCLVFEPMAMDLRKVIKKFGSVGLSIRAVRSYAKQLLVALKHLKKCMILHGDIKPDNIVTSGDSSVVKICDFGSAGKLTDACDITPYLVSRFYRAPEIMLGLKYDQQVDLWSVGTCLYELFCGKILFSGTDNNSMLKCIQDVKGRFPKKMIARGAFAAQHFDQDGVFEWKKVDSVTKQEMRQKIHYEKPVKDLYHLLRSQNAGDRLTGKEATKLKQLADFIHQCLMLDPQQRPQCDELLQHPFITEE